MVDKRNPEKLYERIKKIQKSNPGMSICRAADIADEEHKQYQRSGSIPNPNGNGVVRMA